MIPCRYGLSVNALLRVAASKAASLADSRGRNGQAPLGYAEITAIAASVAQDALLDGAEWLTTDLGDQFDLTGESARRRRERAIIASDKARGR